MTSENKNSIKAIYTEIFFNDKKISTATGFIVGDEKKYFVTNWHVVRGKNFETKELIEKETGAIPNKLKIKYKSIKGKWKTYYINLYNEKGKELWYTHPIYEDDVDVAVIPLTEIEQDIDSTHCFDIESTYELAVTEKAYILGYPFGIRVGKKTNPHALWISGTIASDPILEFEINNKKKPMFLIDSRTRGGQSGSPVIYYSEEGIDNHFFNGKKECTAIWKEPFMQPIGIYSGRYNSDSDIGFVWKWKVIKEIIDSIK